MAIKLSVTLDLQYFKQGFFFKGSGQTKKIPILISVSFSNSSLKISCYLMLSSKTRQETLF